MLDVHALLITPGAATVLGAAGAVSPGGDGCPVAGVPVGEAAVLKMYGFSSVTANTIAALKLTSQDMVDPINGIHVVPGAVSLLNQWFDYTTLTYKKGARVLTAGTNTAVGACTGFLIDECNGGVVTHVPRDCGGEIVTGANTFAGALTANTWGSLPYTPANAIPNGRYAILGAYVSAITNGALIRFQHPSFKGLKPGFPVHNYETISTATWDKMMKDNLVMSEIGQQFIYLGEVLKRPCCPVFEVTNAGTGLTIEMISVQADTPVVNLCIAKVG